MENLSQNTNSYKLVSKKYHPSPTIINFGEIKIGGKELIMMAGPCSVENRDQILTIAMEIKKSGAHFLRGGAFKPRTSPYSFQGLEEEGLKYLKEAQQLTGLLLITEVISENTLEMVDKYVDMFQIGARNVQNFYLLREIGRSKKPVLLKRGPSTTIEEWLYSAEYILSEGNPNVCLCERGIRTFETFTKNTLDLSAVQVVKHLSHLPIIVDPSHGCGLSDYVPALSKASISAGSDGLIIEVHHSPKDALSDPYQQITPEVFDKLCKDISKIAEIEERVFNYLR